MSSSLSVNSTFVSIQGEGFWTGTPATFLRLQGCNLTCPWCDTKQTWGDDQGNMVFIEDLLEHHIQSRAPRTVVVTGGEPLLQQQALNELIRLDRSKGYHHKWHVETNGTLRIIGDLWDWVTVSPKPPEYKVMKSAALAAHEVKIVVTSPETLEVAWELLTGTLFMPGVEWCLQPVDNSPEATAICVEFLTNLREEGRRSWRLSMQVHKFIGVQ